MRLLWLADVLRQAGLTVHEYPGWQSRGSDTWGPLRGVVCHATAGSRTSTDADETRVLWATGSTSAPAPISQLYLSRSGEWWVGASGRCNHVLIGDKGPHKGYGNYNLIGIEAQNDNRGEPWPAVQVESYARGVAAICRKMGWGADRVVGHREHQSGKSDPLGIDMAEFRARVAQLIKGDEGDDDMTPEQDARQRNIDAHTWSTSQMIEVYEVPRPGNNPSAKPVKVTNQLVKAVKDLAARVAALEAKPSAQVDPAQLAAAARQALADPSVVAAVARAAADETHRRMAE